MVTKDITLYRNLVTSKYVNIICHEHEIRIIITTRIKWGKGIKEGSGKWVRGE